MNITKGIQARPQRLVIYGQEGVGKTTLASKLPSPLVLDTEAGSGQLEVDRVAVNSLDDLRGALRDILAEQKAGTLPYRTVVLDTVDRVWNMAADTVCAEKGYKSIEDAGYGKGLKMATEKFCAVITSLDKLVAAGLYVACICHAKVETLSLPDKEDFSVYQLKVSAPGKQAEESAAFLKQWADAVIFCQFDTVLNSATGKAASQKRVMRTAHGACWEAKNRYGLPETLAMDDQGVDALVGAIYGDIPMPAEDAPKTEKPEVAQEPPASAGSSGVASPAPAKAPADDLDASDDLDRWAKEDQTLVEWLRFKGKLGPKQGMDDLDPKVKSALSVPSRRTNALQQALAWKAEQGKGDAA